MITHIFVAAYRLELHELRAARPALSYTNLGRFRAPRFQARIDLRLGMGRRIDLEGDGDDDGRYQLSYQQTGLAPA
jgi:hypothetical protein